MSSWAKACFFVRCETKACAMCSCAGGCADELVRVTVGFGAVRAHKDFVQCTYADELVSVRCSRLE